MRGAALLLLAALLPAGLAAQGDRWEREIARGFVRIDSMMAGQGLRAAGAVHYGALGTEEWDALRVSLPAAGRYAIVGLCDGDCGALELIVSDEGGYDLAADRSGHTVPTVAVVAAAPGVIRVRVFMARCQRNPCRYGVLAYRRGPVALTRAARRP